MKNNLCTLWIDLRTKICRSRREMKGQINNKKQKEEKSQRVRATSTWLPLLLLDCTIKGAVGRGRVTAMCCCPLSSYSLNTLSPSGAWPSRSGELQAMLGQSIFLAWTECAINGISLSFELQPVHDWWEGGDHFSLSCPSPAAAVMINFSHPLLYSSICLTLCLPFLLKCILLFFEGGLCDQQKKKMDSFVLLSTCLVRNPQFEWVVIQTLWLPA